MCGIAGFIHLDGVQADRNIVRCMANALRHRGPDDQGDFVDGPIALGHRRLSIVDLTLAAHQPMVSEDCRYVIVYNGEIYNFTELRAALEQSGWRFHSQSDTEVVLYALIEWGVGALLRFNGMFALAMWDRHESSLLLARDRYGIKPLYVVNTGETLLFASEIKSFYSCPGFRADVDEAALIEYFTFQNFFTNRTLFKGVELLPPATWMRVAPGGSSTRQRYWDYRFCEKISDCSTSEYMEELDHLLRQAVKRQLMGDVPLGAYLSGGIDSGMISAIAASSVSDMTTFTVGFDRRSASGMELAFDERPTAEYMSYLFKTRHYEMVLKAGDMERCMKKLVWHLEEPRVGQSYPNYYAAHLAGKFNKVVLAGTGGDELFGGYPWRYYRAVCNTDFESYVDKYYTYWQRLIPNRDVWRVFAPIKERVGGISTRDIFRDVFIHHDERLVRPEDHVNHSLYFEAKTFLHGLLVVEDKLSMAHGVETRVPFLDNDLVEFATRLPVGQKLGKLNEVIRINENEPGNKLRRYFEKTRDGKLLLRKVAESYLSPEVFGGIKQGFSAPDEHWFKGESIDFVRDCLCSPNARIFNWMDRKKVLGLLDEHLSGKTNRRLLVWSLLYFEEWCQTFLAHRGEDYDG